jgi:hypothetical protein
MNNEPRYNIYIVNRSEQAAVAVVGKDMSERQAEKRMMTALARINDGYYVADEIVGSEADLNYAAQIAANLEATPQLS